MQGATAIAVPGVVAGMDLAHRRFGRMPWRELVAPAVALAEEGLLVDWYASLLIASAARAARARSGRGRDVPRRRPVADRRRLDGAHASATSTSARSRGTLRRIADGGAGEFYRGDVARALVRRRARARAARCREPTSRPTAARIVDALAVPYRGGRVYAAPGMTGGPTLARALRLLAADLVPAARRAGAAELRRLCARARRRVPRAPRRDGRQRARARHAPSCTTHFSVVDRDGNMCAVTQTLLSIFGSRVVSPSTGLLMNNGIMWFDPEPGKPNSLGPGKRCLGNYCPVVGETPDGRRFALGASGGRKILGTVLQIASFMIDHGHDLEAGVPPAAHRHERRRHGGRRPGAAARVIAALRTAFPDVTARRTVLPYAFAVPAGVLRDGELNTGCTEIMSAWGDAVAEPAAGFDRPGARMTVDSAPATLASLPARAADRRAAATVGILLVSTLIACAPFAARIGLPPFPGLILIYQSALSSSTSSRPCSCSRSCASRTRRTCSRSPSALCTRPSHDGPRPLVPGCVDRDGTARRRPAGDAVAVHGVARGACRWRCWRTRGSSGRDDDVSRRSRVARRRRRDRCVARGRSLTAALLVAAAGPLPDMLDDTRYGQAERIGGLVVLALTVVAMAALSKRRHATILDPWLRVVLIAWACEMTLGTLLNQAPLRHRLLRRAHVRPVRDVRDDGGAAGRAGEAPRRRSGRPPRGQGRRGRAREPRRARARDARRADGRVVARPRHRPRVVEPRARGPVRHPPGSFSGNEQTFRDDFVHPDHRARIATAVEQAIAERQRLHRRVPRPSWRGRLALDGGTRARGVRRQPASR